MSEPTHHGAPGSSSSPGPDHGKPGRGQLNIPGVGKLPTWAVLAGLGVVLVLIVRHRSSTAAAAAADTTGAAAADTTGAAAADAGTSGTVSPAISDQVANGPPFTSNAAWSQYAVSVLENNGYDPGELSNTLGLYLNGAPVTAAQKNEIDAAVGVAGYPPVPGPGGAPPAINVAGSVAGGGTGSSGGGTSSGSPGTGGPITVTPVDLQPSHVYATSAQVTWVAPTIPAGQGPLTGYTVACYDDHGHIVDGPFKVGPGQLYGNVSHLKSKSKYHVNVWCDPARTGGPHATTQFETK